MRVLPIVVWGAIVATCAFGALGQTGPTVEELNQQIVALGRKMETGSGFYSYQFDRLIALLSALPATDDRRLAALAIAGRYAKVRELSARAKTVEDFKFDAMRLSWSWRILRSLGVIREGARVEDLVPILGAPTNRFYYRDGSEGWRWEYDSPMHVNPGIEVKVKTGLVVGII